MNAFPLDWPLVIRKARAVGPTLPPDRLYKMPRQSVETVGHMAFNLCPSPLALALHRILKEQPCA